MNILLLGATGMVGQGVLRECLLDPDVERVLAIGRGATGQQHPKLREIINKNLLDLSAIEGELRNLDACFFCLGVSSAGMSEDDYHRITYDLTVAVAQTMARLNPGMTFIYVSGAGTDGTERSCTIWARVKGKTENALLRLPFRGVYMFRPAAIQPLHGIRSKTTLYRLLYTLIGPILPMLKALWPKYVTTTEQMGLAMLHIAKHGAAKQVLETWDINNVGRSPQV